MSSGLENWGGLTEWGVNKLGRINRMGLRAARAEAARAESGEDLEARGLRGRTAAVTMACTHPIPKDERESARTGQRVSERLRPAHQNTKSPNQPLDTSNSIDQDKQKLKTSIEQQKRHQNN